MTTADQNRITAAMDGTTCAECGHLGADLATDGCTCCQRAYDLVNGRAVERTQAAPELLGRPTDRLAAYPGPKAAR